jgi:dihydroneopterin aldolase
MSDKIIIRGLKTPTIIGLLDWEREVRQDLLLDLDLMMDTQPAGTTDEVHKTVDYAAVSQLLISECEKSSFRLIEALAAHLTDVIFSNFGLVDALKLIIKKPGAVPEAEYVGVEIERQRSTN